VGFLFRLPVIEKRVRVAARKTGTFPVVKIPQVDVRSLRLERLSLAGADLSLELALGNPNAFALFLDTMNYTFQIDGKTWASGVMSQKFEVAKEGRSSLQIPIVLDFVSMGQGLFRILSDSEELRYRLGVQLNVGTSLPFMHGLSLDFDREGMIGVVR
jgi:LEA14-like dessication related protein